MSDYKIVELTPAQKQIIKDSVPVLRTAGEALTTAFYKNMFADFPDVRSFFNQSNQASSAQPKILAYAILKYAENIDDLTPLLGFVKTIVAKHVGLQIRAEDYHVVGASLIKTMKQLLGDMANEEFIDAWTVAYGNLAKILIDLEAEEYSHQAWTGFKDFKVTKIENECSDVKSVYFAPVDGKLTPGLPGQYVSIRFQIPGDDYECTRSYSLSQLTRTNEYRISVKRAPFGKVSGYIHEHLKVGDNLRVAPPSGEFVYNAEAKKPIKFIIGGIGITPVMSMLEQALPDSLPVTLYYANRGEDRAFVDILAGYKERYPHFKVIEHISDEPSIDQAIDEVKYGKLSPEDIEADHEDEVYLLGPVSFMTDMRDHLVKRSITPKLEFFGPVVV
jgi:nitric oxide dioxygenase